MNTEKGEPVFENIDAVLIDKIIEKTRQNIDSTPDTPHKPPERSPDSGASFRLIVIALLGVILIGLFIRSKRNLR